MTARRRRAAVSATATLVPLDSDEESVSDEESASHCICPRLLLALCDALAFQVAHGRVPWRVVRRAAGWQHLHPVSRCGVEEEGKGKSARRRLCAVTCAIIVVTMASGRRIDYVVTGRHPSVIGYLRQQLPRVHYESARHRPRLHPPMSPRREEDKARTGSGEHRDKGRVHVWMDAKGARRRWRIAREAHTEHGILERGSKRVWPQAQSNGVQGEHAYTQGVHLVREGLHRAPAVGWEGAGPRRPRERHVAGPRLVLENKSLVGVACRSLRQPAMAQRKEAYAIPTHGARHLVLLCQRVEGPRCCKCSLDNSVGDAVPHHQVEPDFFPHLPQLCGRSLAVCDRAGRKISCEIQDGHLLVRGQRNGRGFRGGSP
mmetsp:Transcript_13579/g.36346  ORF Transcript_13579/g.36346 Transcript_13579/m.36346 type:complete len:373 (+) Transcript_13579:379-1497(+)